MQLNHNENLLDFENVVTPLWLICVADSRLEGLIGDIHQLSQLRVLSVVGESGRGIETFVLQVDCLIVKC